MFFLPEGNLSQNLYIGLRVYSMLKNGKVLVNFANTNFYINLLKI